MNITLEALRKSIARWTDKGELLTTSVPGLSLYRRDEPPGPMSGMYEPSICLVAQGAKRVSPSKDRKFTCKRGNGEGGRLAAFSLGRNENPKAYKKVISFLYYNNSNNNDSFTAS